MKFIKFLFSFFPTPLPTGRTSYNQWVDDIVALGADFADRDSIEFALCSIIVHLPPDQGSKSKRFFIQTLRKAAATQVASTIFQEIKEAQSKPQSPADTSLPAPIESTGNGETQKA